MAPTLGKTVKLTSFQKVMEHRGAPRVWIESHRLNTVGFADDTRFAVRPSANRLVLTPDLAGDYTVSSRRAAGNFRPIIDLNSRDTLSPIAGFTEVRISASYKQVVICPSVRAFHIRRRLNCELPFRAMEFFAGASLLGSALPEEFKLVAGLEVEPDYADVFVKQHPDAELFQTCIRMIHPSELPNTDVWLVGIPCTSHSNMGRAKKSLAGIPELGDTGDLFMPVAGLVAAKMPLAVVFENVPSFATSLAGLSLASYLRKLGYHLHECVLDPHGQWNEPQDRRRWVMVATLQPGFEIVPPNIPFAGDLTPYLDPADPVRDVQDAKRIANTIACLRKHNKRHQDMGHGFGFTTINHQSKKVPTLVRSYHKINVGPFVECEGGLRMLRKAEAERLMGCTVPCDHYATAIQVLFQGVQSRVFRTIFEQLAAFLILNKLK